MAFYIKTKIEIVFFILLIVILSLGSLYYIVASRHELYMHELQEEIEESSLVRDLQLALTRVVMPLNDFLIAGADPNEPENYKALSVKVKALIEKLSELEFDKPEEREFFDHVKKEYQQIEDIALQIFSIHNPIGNPEAGRLMEEVDKIGDDALTNLEKFHLLALKEMEESQIDWKKTKYLLNLILFIGVSLSIFIIIGALVFFSRNIISPLKSLKNAALEFAQGNLDKRVNVKTNDEIGFLANAFNKMGAELKKSYTALKNENTKRILAEEIILDSEERFRSVADTAKDAIVSIDSNGEIVFWNTAAENIFGYSADEAVGKLATLVIPKEFHEAHQQGIDRAIKTGGLRMIGKNLELPGLRKDGSAFPIEISLSTWKVKAGVFFTAIIRDITERKKLEKKLRTLSLSDELTGLSNRRGFFAVAEHLLKIAKRQKQGIYLLYADVDNFKDINDTLGHKEGDNALIDIANILRTSYRESDVVARIGGDEFVVIPVGTAGDCIEMIISRLQEKLDDHNKKSNRSYKLSVSVGIAYYDPENPCSVDELLVQGDKMMYEQKQHT